MKRVAVLGAAGFIGRFVAAELVRQGWRVRAFVHVSEALPTWHGQEIELVRGDIRDYAAVRAALDGCRAAINCVGAKSDEPESEAVNVGGARHLVRAAQEVGCRRLIQISTQAVKIARKGRYARTKLEADRVLWESGLAVTILRPSVVYGPGRSGVFSTMEAMMDRLPLIPVLGSGKWVCYPVYVEDVARMVAACLQTPSLPETVYDLGGPEAISLNALLGRLADVGGRKVRTVHVPFVVALTAARLLAAVQRTPAISVSNVLGSNQDTGFDDRATRRDLPWQVLPLAEGLARMSGVAAGDAVGLQLAAEARRFGRYLLGVELSAELQGRYVAAVRRRLGTEEDALLMWVRRRPWTLPWLDAAAGLWRPQSLLRQRLLVAAAVFEASTDHAGFYLQPVRGRIAVVGEVVRRAFLAVLKLAVGSILMVLVPRP